MDREYNIFKCKIEDTLHILLGAEEACVECGCRSLELDKEYHLFCKGCGLVLAAVDPYVAGMRIDLPFGLLI